MEDRLTGYFNKEVDSNNVKLLSIWFDEIAELTNAIKELKELNNVNVVTGIPLARLASNFGISPQESDAEYKNQLLIYAAKATNSCSINQINWLIKKIFNLQDNEFIVIENPVLEGDISSAASILINVFHKVEGITNEKIKDLVDNILGAGIRTYHFIEGTFTFSEDLTSPVSSRGFDVGTWTSFL